MAPRSTTLVLLLLLAWMPSVLLLRGQVVDETDWPSLLGDGDDAAGYLNKLLDSSILPNTLYVTSSPCIEVPLSAAASLNDMLLSSWGDRIRVFPGVPGAWKDVVFHNLRTQGAFLVSASRKNGRTEWVRVKSLAGEPCRIRPGLEGEIQSTVPMTPAGDGVYDLKLAKGGEALLYVGTCPPRCVVAPVAADPAKANFYGRKK